MRSLWLLLLLLSAATAQRSCVQNLTQVALQEVFVTNTEFAREYVLCVNTLYETGVLNDEGQVEVGFFPLAVRGNTTVKCGQLGRRDRGCTIAFGSVGLLLAPFDTRNFDPIDYGTTKFIGLTFDDLRVAPVFSDLAYGTVIFEDCAFINSVAEPNIQLSSPAEPATRRDRRRLQWQREYIPQHNNFSLPNFLRVTPHDNDNERRHTYHQRKLQNGGRVLNVEFVNCLFQDNRGPRAFTYDSGLTMIYMPGPDVNLKIRRSTFSFNNFQQYGPQFPQATTKALLTSFGTNNQFELRDNCFSDNTVIGFGLMNSFSQQVTLEDNHVATPDPSLGCEFWGFMEVDPVRGTLSLSGCQTSDATVCSLDIPTLAPSAAPTRKSAFCVSALSLVHVEQKQEWTQIKDISIGDRVLVGPNNKYEPVYGFAHYHEDKETDYLLLYTNTTKTTVASATDRPLEITADHMVMTVDGLSVPAGTIRVGDELVLIQQDGSSTTAPVTRIRHETRRGLYGPFTPSGKIVVNGIQISNFVALQPTSGNLMIGSYKSPITFQWMGETFEAPHRIVSLVFGYTKESYNENGFSSWVHLAHRISQFFIQQPPYIMALLCIPMVAFLLTVSLLEGIIIGSVKAWVFLLLCMGARAILTRRNQKQKVA